MTQLINNFDLIDSHCHLEFDPESKSVDLLIQEAQNAHIIALVNVCTETENIPRLEEISEKYEFVYHTVGVHPHDTAKMNAEDLVKISAATKHPKCRAIGEIGLDYYYDYSPHDIQIKQLENQLELALNVDLPIVIHARDAEEDLIKILTQYAKKTSSHNTVGVIHCFTGTQNFADAMLDLGFYISFSGILTFKNAESLRSIAQTIPLEKLLIETDAPFLAPIPFRGKKCEPSMILKTAEKLAEIRELSIQEIATICTKNTQKLFNLK